MTEQYLKDHLISLPCDVVTVVVDRNGEVAKLLKNMFSSIIIWFFLNYRLELAIYNVTKKIYAINKFKMFMDKLHALYHVSPKNSRKLKHCVALLKIKILKIGRILGTRWVASSYRTVFAT